LIHFSPPCEPRERTDFARFLVPYSSYNLKSTLSQGRCERINMISTRTSFFGRCATFSRKDINQTEPYRGRCFIAPAYRGAFLRKDTGRSRRVMRQALPFGQAFPSVSVL
jgi:hypothetical protein